MDYLLGTTILFISGAIQLLTSYILWPLLQIYVWYLIYSVAILAIKIVAKLRYEVFNEDLKYKPEECENKVLVITGATSGIGLAATKYFLSKQFTVIACYFSKEEPGFKDLEEKSNNQTRKSLFLVELNVRNLESIKICHKQVREILDSNDKLKFHALVNVAGLGFLQRFQWQTRETIQATLETNLYGPIMMTKEFMSLLVKSAPHSRLVNISSPLSTLNVPYNTIYCATKAGLTHFTNSIRIDSIRYKVKTVNIYPGNLIRNTAILHSSLKAGHDSLLATLSDEERKLYGNELDEQEQLRVKMDQAKDRPTNLKLSVGAKLSRNLYKLGLIASGALDDQQLECSNLMNGFDNAIRSRDPPKDIFAGNQFFEIFVGAHQQFVSYAFLRDCVYFLEKYKLITLL